MSCPPISRRVRSGVREWLVGYTLAEIDRLFEDEGFVAHDLPAEQAGRIRGDRRYRAEEFLFGIDWNDHAHRQRFLRVLETLLDNIDRDVHPDFDEIGWWRHLRRDGYELDGHGRITTTTREQLLTLPLEVLADPATLEAEVERLARGWSDDPGQVLTAAGSLVAATCTRILFERDAVPEGLGDNPKVPKLLDATTRELWLHPTDAPERFGKGVADASRTVLGGMARTVNGLAQLRNLASSSHPAEFPIPPRYSHLAAHAAVAVCRMLLETHAARTAAADSHRDERAVSG